MKHNFCWILNLAKHDVEEIPEIFYNLYLRYTTDFQRPSLHLYVRSKCLKTNDTLPFTDKN